MAKQLSKCCILNCFASHATIFCKQSINITNVFHFSPPPTLDFSKVFLRSMKLFTAGFPRQIFIFTPMDWRRSPTIIVYFLWKKQVFLIGFSLKVQRDMRYFARSKYCSSLVHRKHFSLIWQVVFKLGYVFYHER